ncbi:hypothetical protein B4135_0864 [Caldibacillus debilis]|uniref:Thioredoxin domain-containing protein n=2 Tax=Caldibacillus debilis TaxID=301148 RepID=A0A150M6D1_9BACI|nr:hypothetical protein B4135_0864 [Caldibacillus debilis]
MIEGRSKEKRRKESMQEITTAEQYEKIIQSDNKIAIKFYTTWCPDCKRLDMFIGDILPKFPHLTWYQMDRDKFPEIAEKQKVLGIPSILIFSKGEKLGHLHSANAKTPEEVEAFLQKF